jgi:NADH-quinone oxidoreductase subunit C
MSMTYRRRLRLETAVTARHPHVATVTGVYPTADFHERETWTCSASCSTVTPR